MNKNMLPQRRRLYILVGVFICVCFAPASSQAQGARRDSESTAAAAAAASRVVRAFYRFHFAHDMNFTARGVRQRRGWLSAELYRLLSYELRRESRRSRTHLDEAPYMEGDPFTNSQEFPTSFRVGTPVLSSPRRAKVEVTFLWSGASSRGRDERKVFVELSMSGGRWLIGNIIDDGGKDLLSELKRPED